jgi:hypothetical protein
MYNITGKFMVNHYAFHGFLKSSSIAGECNVGHYDGFDPLITATRYNPLQRLMLRCISSLFQNER